MEYPREQIILHSCSAQPVESTDTSINSTSIVVGRPEPCENEENLNYGGEINLSNELLITHSEHVSHNPAIWGNNIVLPSFPRCLEVPEASVDVSLLSTISDNNTSEHHLISDSDCSNSETELKRVQQPNDYVNFQSEYAANGTLKSKKARLEDTGSTSRGSDSGAQNFQRRKKSNRGKKNPRMTEKSDSEEKSSKNTNNQDNSMINKFVGLLQGLLGETNMKSSVEDIDGLQNGAVGFQGVALLGNAAEGKSAYKKEQMGKKLYPSEIRDKIPRSFADRDVRPKEINRPAIHEEESEEDQNIPHHSENHVKIACLKKEIDEIKQKVSKLDEVKLDGQPQHIHCHTFNNFQGGSNPTFHNHYYKPEESRPAAAGPSTSSTKPGNFGLNHNQK